MKSNVILHEYGKDKDMLEVSFKDKDISNCLDGFGNIFSVTDTSHYNYSKSANKSQFTVTDNGTKLILKDTGEIIIKIKGNYTPKIIIKCID